LCNSAEEAIQNPNRHEWLKRGGCGTPNCGRKCQGNEPKEDRISPEIGGKRYGSNAASAKHEDIAYLRVVDVVFGYIPMLRRECVSQPCTVAIVLFEQAILTQPLAKVWQLRLQIHNQARRLKQSQKVGIQEHVDELYQWKRQPWGWCFS
jgi:hypothetical protein